jgi:1-acyl-sn-glycerol-3-phosphate acyltransferase
VNTASPALAIKTKLTCTPAKPARLAGERLPTNWLWLTRLFAAYSERLVRRSFHSVRLLGAVDLGTLANRPLVIYANHPSWWDPLTGLVAWRRLFADRIPYAPIDSVAVEKYAFFKKLGFFGVERNSTRGARNFLRVARELLRRGDTLLFMTPQGQFADVREPRLEFEAGLGHLFRQSPGTAFLPLAVEYTFWEEKHPEVLIRFGEPLLADDTNTALPAGDINRQLVDRLEAARRRLAAASVSREVEAFQTLLGGRAGTNPVYDAWRWLKATLRGQRFNAANGDK